MIANIPTGVWLVPLVAVVAGWYSTWDYSRDALAGRLRPSLTSWGVWTVTAALGTGTAWAAGSTVGAVVSAATFLRCAQVLATTGYVIVRDVRRKRRGLDPLAAAPEHTRAQRILDVSCLVACVGVGVAWQVTDDAVLGLMLAIGVDAVAAVPTIYHGWKRQEEPKPYLIGMIGPTVALLCLPQRVLADYAWPLWELAVNILLVSGPLIVGWPGGRFRLRVRVGVSAALAALYASAVALVFTVIPAPPPPAPGQAVGAAGGAAAAAALAGPPQHRAAQVFAVLDGSVGVRTLLVVAATVLFAGFVLPVTWQVARGKVPASPVTWTAWAALGVVALISIAKLGDPVATVQAAVLGASAALMAAAAGWARLRGNQSAANGVSWQRYVDWACGVGALIAFVALLRAGPEAAIWLTIATDLIAFIPTITMAYRDPHDQPWLMFAAVAVSTGLTIIAAAPPDQFVDVVYLVYVVAQMSVLVMTIVIRLWWLEEHRPVPTAAAPGVPWAPPSPNPPAARSATPATAAPATGEKVVPA